MSRKSIRRHSFTSLIVNAKVNDYHMSPTFKENCRRINN